MTLYLNTPLLDLPLAGQYGMLMLDPPWKSKRRSDKGYGRSAERHYQTMSLDELKAMPIRQLAGKDCWIALWTTWPHLRQALSLLDSWGASYSSNLFTWVKLNPKAASALLITDKDFHRGTGYTSRKNTEVCLLAKFGRPKVLTRVDELIVTARREHSRKPDEAFTRALKFCSAPHLEVFSRESRTGWDTWGNEAGKFDPPGLVAPDTPALVVPDVPQLTAVDDDASIPAFIRSLTTV